MIDAPEGGPDLLRLDKWLWQARFFKTRSLAARVVTEKGVRIDGTRVSKPSATVRPGVMLTFPQASRIRVVRVLALGERRGPATEAQALYEDHSAPPPPPDPGAPVAEKGGRPTKRERRAMGPPDGSSSAS